MSTCWPVAAKVELPHIDMGHNMMVEPGWTAVAERIHNWLGGRGL
jgi:hypothetical protein